MLNINKYKGVTLIELMVALSLGIILMFSMLTFYSVTQQNLATHMSANKEQQELRKTMHLISRNIENTGAFECAENSTVFKDIGALKLVNLKDATIIDRVGIQRFPKEIISLGEFERKDRQQFIFTHPISEEHLDRSLGMMDIHEIEGVTTAHYSPIEVKANCGTQDTSIYIGSTIVEVIPMKDHQPPITDLTNQSDGSKNPLATNISAFTIMSSLQTKLFDIDDKSDDDTVNFNKTLTTNYDRAYFLKRARSYSSGTDTYFSSGVGSAQHLANSDNNDDGKNQYSFGYLPSIYDGTIAFLSDNTETESSPTPDSNLPFGRNKVEISLGFAASKHAYSVPEGTMKDLKDGGWLDPYASENAYNLIVDTCAMDACSDPDDPKTFTNNNAQLINRVLHPEATDPDGYAMRTYPLRPEAAEQVRAVKFKFTFNMEKPAAERIVITRVVRFKNTYLKRLKDE